MSTEEIEFRVKESRSGRKTWLFATLAILPGLAFAIMLATDLTGWKFGIIWFYAIYFILLGAWAAARAKARAGDRIVIRHRQLCIYRGDQLREMLSPNQVREVIVQGSRIIIKHDHEFIDFLQANYDPETWCRMKDTLKEFASNKSPIAAEMKK